MGVAPGSGLSSSGRSKLGFSDGLGQELTI